jgi:hypothetical protein
MAFEQKVGEGWRCDGCGKLERWGESWSVIGTMFEEDEGVLRWVSCSEACRDLCPHALAKLKTPMPSPFRGLSSSAQEQIERLRATAGWRAREARPASVRVEQES